MSRKLKNAPKSFTIRALLQT